MFEAFRARNQIEVITVREDIEGFIVFLKGFDDASMTRLVVLATQLRLNLDKDGLMPRALFELVNPVESPVFGQVLCDLGDGVRAAQEVGKNAIANAAIVWHLSFRATAYPEITFLGQEMWREISRGFPGALEQWIILKVPDSPPPEEEFFFVPWQLKSNKANLDVCRSSNTAVVSPQLMSSAPTPVPKVVRILAILVGLFLGWALYRLTNK